MLPSPAAKRSHACFGFGGRKGVHLDNSPQHKERLARIHPLLIFKNIDAKDCRKEQTVGLYNLPQRLGNLGIALDSEDAKLIATFAEWRNQIVHRMPSFDERTADLQLPRLLDFLAEFLRRELTTPLEQILPKALYSTALGLLQDWRGVVEGARERARGEGNRLPDACPGCAATGVLCLRDERRVYCHLCGAKHSRYDHCVQCQRQTLISYSAFDDGNYCDDCISAAGDQYLQMLIDIERGK